LTEKFLNVWQENLQDKELRAHAKASQLLAVFLSKLKTTEINATGYFRQIFSVVPKVKSSELLQTITKTLIKKADNKRCEWAISRLGRIDKEKSGYFVVNQLYNFAKKSDISQELVQDSLKQLFEISISQDQNLAEFARKMILVALGQLDKDNSIFVYGLIKEQKNENYPILAGFVSKIGKIKISDSEDEQLGKRKAKSSSLITQSQLDTLKQLGLVLGIESFYLNNFSICDQLIELATALISNRPNKQKEENPLDMLFNAFYKEYTKSVSYTRGLIKKTFQEFVGEISMNFVDKLCLQIQSRMNISEEVIKKPSKEEKVVENLSELKPENSDNSQKQIWINTLRNDLSLRVCDLIEIIIKNTENHTILLKLYKTLIKCFKAAFKRKKRTGLAERYHYLMDEISKIELSVDKSETSDLGAIFAAAVKCVMREKNLNKFLAKTLFNLVKIIDKANHEEATQVVNDTISNYMTSKNPKLSLDVLSGIVLALSFDKYILNLLHNYVKTGKDQKKRLEALEILKKMIKLWPYNDKDAKKLFRAIKQILDEKLKNKEKNKLLKNILAALFIYSKKTTEMEQFCKRLERIKPKLSNIPSLSGIISQISKSSKI